MKIVANSKEFEVKEGTNVADFARSLSLRPERCVVELNKKALRFSQFKDIILKDGDMLEIMSVVAGG